MKLSDQLETINRFRRRVPVDVEGLATALGVGVKYAYLDGETSGMLERLSEGKGYRITVNELNPRTRQRFTIAHELGHFVLHRPLVGDGVDDDKAYRSTNVGRYHNTLIGPKQETEANRFAANVLMPRDLVDAAVEEIGDKDATKLAPKFEVSEHAMSIRLGVPYHA